MKKYFDLIIANPPYGKVGANITKTIIDYVDFDSYINLLPANDYQRNDTHDLFKYTRDMIPIIDGFDDAAVTTHLANIVKQPNSLTEGEFERGNYIDRQLDKYFAENADRSHYAIDTAMYKPALSTFNSAAIAVTKSIYIGKRDVSNGHLPYATTSIVTRYNKNQITKQEVINASAKSEQACGKVGDFYLINFNTEIEKTNFADFMYSKDGFRFLCKIFVALNVDSSISLSKFLPKVDWTRSWTVEEILKDYGYTETEIKEVMDDLVNFKGMEN